MVSKLSKYGKRNPKNEEIKVKMRTIFLFLLVFFQFSLGAKEIESSYRKALHKRNFHYISGVDYIYVINAKKDLTKFRELKKQFGKYDIVPYRFNALEASKLTYKDISNVGLRPTKVFGYDALQVKRSGKNWILSLHQMLDINCAYFNEAIKIEEISRNIDFLSVIYDAYKSKYKTVWIMEDDAEILMDPNIITGYLVQMKMKHPNWDILYTDVDSRNTEDPYYTDYFYPLRPDVRFEHVEVYEDRATASYPISKVGLRHGSCSFILNRKAMKKILDYYHKNRFFIPFSVEVQMIPNLKLYCLKDEVVTNRT